MAIQTARTFPPRISPPRRETWPRAPASLVRAARDDYLLFTLCTYLVDRDGPTGFEYVYGLLKPILSFISTKYCHRRLPCRRGEPAHQVEPARRHLGHLEPLLLLRLIDERLVGRIGLE